MCGITGFIGNSKNKDLSFNLTTKLFERSEIRGIDAAGFWAAIHGVNGGVIYHKEPIRSSKFIKNEFWSTLSEFDVDCVIAHARGASKGVGEPFFNENNHPFTSTDKCTALAHNGRIEDEEYYELKKYYEVSTSCDSEILLRIFESRMIREERNKELEAIKEIFSLINQGHMAVAVGRRHEGGKRSLWLFRNEHRPLWISDLREELGQIFFVSEPAIWEAACDDCGSKMLSMCYKLTEIKPQEIWEFNLSDNNISTNRYEIEKIEQEEHFSSENYFQIPQKNPCFEVITRLDENDQIIRNSDISWSEIDIDSLEECVAGITEKVKSIETELKYMALKELIDKDFFEKVTNQLKKQEDEIKKIVSVIYGLYG